MNPKLKIAQIDRLADAIGYIASDFEKFGGLFLEALLEIPMNHQGTNLVGYPVGGVIDTVSEDGLTVAEYSDQAGYFDSGMTKAQGDLRKAIRRKPQARNIFLLSGKRKRPQIAQAFESEVATWTEMKDKTLHLWGAEEIAGYLVKELIFSDTVVRRLAPYLPELGRIRDEEAVSRLAPAPDRRSIPRPEVEKEMSRRLALQPVLAIGGIGGLGKSAMAAQYAANHEDDFDLVVWLDADEVRRPESLHALTLIRGGEIRNLTALLQCRACLVVIDDLGTDFPTERLNDLCGSKSKIILTQRAITSSSYQLPMLSRTDALAVLDREGASCPPQIFDVIWATIGGHPLSLGLIGAAVREGASWPEIVLDCEAVGAMEHRGQPLAERLLGRLRASLAAELSIFVWAGQPTCGQDFLAHVIKPLGIRKLRTHGLTAIDRSGILRLHDVVFASLNSDWCPLSRQQELDNALEAYLVSVSREPGLRLWTIARILRPKLENLLEGGSTSAAFRYALLAVWDPGQLRGELVGDPVVHAKQLLKSVVSPMAISAIIEAIEQLWLSDAQEGYEVARTRLDARLPTFDLLASLDDLTEREITEIKHHKGKALKRLGDIASAASLFESVLDGPAPLHEARLQLIDIYRTDKTTVPRTIELVDDILGLEPGQNEVTYSVLLGVIERLPWGTGTWRADVIRRHAEAIERTIVEAAEVGVQQAFSAFSALGRFLSTEDPAMFERVWLRLPEPTIGSLETDSERFAWAEIYFEASRLEGAESAPLRQKALALHDAEVKPSPFHLQRRAELLIDMGQAAEGEAHLSSRADLYTSEWIQRLMARARLTQGDSEGALSWINKALELLKAEHFRSEFLELRYDARVALGDSAAGDDLVAARAQSQKARESARLDARIKAELI